MIIMYQIKAYHLCSMVSKINCIFYESKNDLNHDQDTYPKMSRFFIGALHNYM